MKSILLFIPFILLVTCETNPKGQTMAAGSAPPPVSTFPASAVLEEVNALRSSGCQCPGGRYYAPAPALQPNQQLEIAAQAHADDMYRKRYFSHKGADGSDFSDRISRAGYRWSAIGENIAKGYPTAHAVVEAWRKSKDHCPNMMNPGFRDMGVGNAGPYWVQDLGTRK